MPRERPPAVLVMAILNLVLGGLGILGTLLCGGVGPLFAAVLSEQAVADPLGNPYTAVEKQLPGYIAFAIGSLVLNLLLSILLVIAGLGLLRMESWARRLCIGYGMASLVVTLAGLVFTLAYVNPAVARWQRERDEQVLRQQQQQGNVLAGRPGVGASLGSPSWMNNLPALGSALFSMAYATALLVVMFLPDVSDAFAGRPRRPRVSEDEDEGDDIAGRPWPRRSERLRVDPEDEDDAGGERRPRRPRQS
jgi:hypothetical protein